MRGLGEFGYDVVGLDVREAPRTTVGSIVDRERVRA
jgi:hypothetical protein